MALMNYSAYDDLRLVKKDIKVEFTKIEEKLNFQN